MTDQRLSHLAQSKGAKGMQSECGLLIHGQGDVTLPVPQRPSHSVSLTHARIIDIHELRCNLKSQLHTYSTNVP